MLTLAVSLLRARIRTKTSPDLQSSSRNGRRFAIATVMSASIAVMVTTGCGGKSSPIAMPANTHATLLITATNNAQIPIFKFNIQGLTLVASDGTNVPVLTTSQIVELGSINGVARPLVTTGVPQGNYTSVKLSYGPSTFVVIDHSGGAGSIDFGNYSISTTGNQAETVTLSLSTPLVVSGSSMGLLLDLNIPKSTTYVPFFDGSMIIAPNGGQTTFTPVFSLSGVTPAAQPSTLQDGKVEDVHGQVTSNSNGEITIASDSGSSLSFSTASSTVYSGVSAAGAPAAGSFVAVDAALQADGSMLATSVLTEGTTQPYNIVGQVLYSNQPYLENTGREQQGPNLPNGTGFYQNNVKFNPATPFVIGWPSGTAPEGLPFTPSLNQASISIGQNVSTPVNALQTAGNIIPATSSVTLEPQTIDATITAISTVNGQQSYQVSLFPNDFIALFGPSQTVVVYATANTHSITSSSLTNGSVGRFRGLLFNDGGTLRMVATEIEDGVPGS